MKYLKKYKGFKNRLFENNSEIDSICREYSITNYTINSDGSIDVEGDVLINFKRDLGKLPLRFGRVTGKFKCVRSGLTTLEGCPQFVGGDFDCSANNLTTLEYGPQEVLGSYNCSFNQLSSLEGCAQIIGSEENPRNLICSNNQLYTLNGSPELLWGDLHCHNNKLKDLTGCPSKIGGHLWCPQNEITSLKGAPDTIGGDFNCKENRLESLEFYPKEIGKPNSPRTGNVYLSGNKLTTLKDAPQMINGNFYCDNNLIDSFEDSKIVEVLGTFNCSNNKLTSLQGCPKVIDSNLDCSMNQITMILIEDLDFITIESKLICDGNPIYEIFKTFGDFEKFKKSLDYNYLQEPNEIIEIYFSEACEELGVQKPGQIKGYVYL
jgi:hypothetical protein